MESSKLLIFWSGSLTNDCSKKHELEKYLSSLPATIFSTACGGLLQPELERFWFLLQVCGTSSLNQTGEVAAICIHKFLASSISLSEFAASSETVDKDKSTATFP